MVATAGLRPGRRGILTVINLGGPAAEFVQRADLRFGADALREPGGRSSPIGYLLARLLASGHAGWIGRRWARRVRDRVAAAVHDEVSQRGLSPLDALEDARGRLWMAATDIDRSCDLR